MNLPDGKLVKPTIYICAVCIEIKNVLSDIISTPLCTLLALPASLSQNAWCALSLTPNPISNYAFAVLQGRRSRGYLAGACPSRFGRSVNPISTGGRGECPIGFSDLPVALFFCCCLFRMGLESYDFLSFLRYLLPRHHCRRTVV